MSRDSLDFCAAVNRDVGEILSSAGLTFSQSSPWSVWFTSADAKIEIYYGIHSFEIGLIAVCGQANENTFSLSELLRYWKHPELQSYRNFVATDTDAVFRGVQGLARLLDDLIALGLRFDQKVNDELLAQQRDISARRASEVRCEQARRRASEARAEKDYAGVESAFADIEKFLTEVEFRQLEYARKQSLKPK